MTDSTDQTGLPPEQDAVRRLLADARHDGATPPEVVARLDATLAALASERHASPAPTGATKAPVVDLGARRRRMAGIGLLAAAAVVVAGVAVGNGLPSISRGSDDSSASSAGGSSQELSDSGADGGADSSMSQQPKAQLSPDLMDQPQLSTTDDDLDDDLLLLRDTMPAASASSESARAAVCAVPGVGRGRQVGVDVDGVPGLVVFRRPDDSTQRVDLYVCGDAAVVRTLTLPAP
ncbi:hypothetical protein L2K70_12785 [Nocardioides KLBMP 9356]|uniref:DUF1707 domain-containing protein n=1 Tax=Nocardioides potassii TaxID=2911371 RepID=A0ABS9HBB6_9ACTN|nr:hypothetical protein [Nocardioides potassii]MCF6378480.1 hypothetical protein [Nocardioides potassii]